MSAPPVPALSPPSPGTPPASGQRVLVKAFAEDPLAALEGDEHLTLEAMDPPDPATLAVDDVLVAVRSAAVNWVDLLMTSGQYQHLPPLPYTPGLEYAGDVLWKGAAVSDAELRVGDAVFSDGFLTGPRSLGAHQRYGGFASYAVAPARALRRLPGALTYDQSCNLLGNYETAYHCLIHCGRLQAGETVLILGASGGTGLAAVHIARQVGAKVIATGRSAQKGAQVQAQGADHVLLTGGAEGPRLREQVKALTGGAGVDVVYDGVGGELSLEALRCCRFGARYLIVGWAGTPSVARGKGQGGAPNANQLPTNLILMKGLQVLGCPTVLATVQDPRIRAPRLQQILRWVEAGQLHPLVARGYPLSDYREAMRTKWRGELVGACVLHPSSR